VATGVGAAYQMWWNGAIWQYLGVPCNASGCTGWLPIGNNASTVQIAVGGVWGSLYTAQSNGSIWAYTGIPCNANDICSGWEQLDNNPKMWYVVGGTNTVYQVHQDRSIWQYVGPPCNGSVCSGWVELDNNPSTYMVVTGL